MQALLNLMMSSHICVGGGGFQGTKRKGNKALFFLEMKSVDKGSVFFV